MSKTSRLIEQQQAQIRDLETRWHEERDRRYAEVASERERALQRFRESQQRQDKEAAELMERILERLGQCTTHDDFEAFRREREQTLKPLMEFVAAERGRSTGTETTRSVFFAIGGLASGCIMAVVGIGTVLMMWAAWYFKH